MKKTSPYSETKSTRILPMHENIKKKPVKSVSEDKNLSKPNTTRVVVSELISDLIEDTVAPKDKDHTEDESTCSLDTSSITDMHGNPTTENLSESSQYLN